MPWAVSKVKTSAQTMLLVAANMITAIFIAFGIHGSETQMIFWQRSFTENVGLGEQT
jgi:hypothetical protein